MIVDEMVESQISSGKSPLKNESENKRIFFFLRQMVNVQISSALISHCLSEQVQEQTEGMIVASEGTNAKKGPRFAEGKMRDSWKKF